MISFIRSDYQKHRKKYQRAGQKIVLFAFFFSIIVVFSFWLPKWSLPANILYAPATQNQVQEDFSGTLYFNAQEHSTHLQTKILEAIASARQSIDVAMYSIDMPEVEKALIQAQERGVEVRLILSKNKSKQHEDLVSHFPADQVFQLGDEEVYMHNKYLLIDKGKNPQLLFGSLNYTSLQERYDPSFILETRDPYFIEPFILETERLIQRGQGTFKFQEGDYSPFSQMALYSNGFVETWFSPGFKENSVKTRILEMIDQATSSIDIMIWRMTDKDIAKALVEKGKQGVNVRVITDDYYLWSQASSVGLLLEAKRAFKLDSLNVVSDGLRTLDLNQKIEEGLGYFNPYFHQHTLLVDDKMALSGSNNWSFNGFYRNDESIVISNVDFWVKGFRASFDHNFGELQGSSPIFLQNGMLSSTTLPQGAQRVLVVLEESEKQIYPKICFEQVLTEDSKSIEIPKNCFQSQARLLVLDGENKLLGSLYL